ncbi:DUF4397 domain-containing protein [Salinibaculum salinum]|uniref:DUF4397 domain-containing protein n=1 Tax=Salinibaculum salinum TaxID=3131996 RepID=UPI0030EE8098
MVDPLVRVGHCSPDAPNVDIHVDGNLAFQDVAFEDISEYTTLSAGNHDIRITPAGADAPLVDAPLALHSDTKYTILATGMLDNIEATVFEDDPGEVPSGKAHVRFIHASPDAPRVTVQVADGPKLFRRMKYRKMSDYEQVDAGSYDIEAVAKRGEEPVLRLSDLQFDGGGAYTVIAVGQVQEGTLDALSVEDAMAEIAADD